jgi:hypothetical protein
MCSRAGRLRSAIARDERHWRYVGNFKPWITYHLCQHPLTDLQRLLLDSLRHHGIAITTVEDLGAQEVFEELAKAACTLETGLSGTINRVREQANTPGFKTYLLELLGPRPILDPKDIFRPAAGDSELGEQLFRHVRAPEGIQCLAQFSFQISAPGFAALASRSGGSPSRKVVRLSDRRH